jgi:branched-chain amino acid transport system substrate-binding protein
MTSRALTLALAISALLLAHSASAQIFHDVVKLGVLTDLSGPASDATGQGSVTAAEMTVADFGGKVAGKSDAQTRHSPESIRFPRPREPFV